MRHSSTPRNRIFVKVIGFCLSLNIWNISSKYSQKLFDYDKQSTTDALKTVSKIKNKKIAEAAGDLIGNKITDNSTRKLSRSPPETALCKQTKISRNTIRKINITKKNATNY